MPRTAEDLETYLLRLDRRFDVQEGTYVLRSTAEVPPIALRVAPPIVAFRVTIGPVPTDAPHQLRFFRRLLEYNATDLMHASYGIEGGTVVLAAALPLDNLDENELEAVLSDIDLALMRHVPALKDAAQA